MPDLWDWADVAALAIMARHDFESVSYCKPGWECQGGTVPYVLAHLDWRAAEHKQIAAGIRYGAAEAERAMMVRIPIRVRINQSGPTVEEFEKRLLAALEPKDGPA